MDKKFFAIIPILLLITLLYQNCSGKAGFTQRTDNEIAADNNDANGDYGTGGGGYTCVSGQKLSIYIDKDNSGRIVKDNYL